MVADKGEILSDSCGQFDERAPRRLGKEIEIDFCSLGEVFVERDHLHGTSPCEEVLRQLGEIDAGAATSGPLKTTTARDTRWP